MAMTYKESLLKNDRRLGTANLVSATNEQEANIAESFLTNQSPVMKAWFVMMVINLALFLILLH